MRADADYMIWWHAEDVEALQGAYADLRRTTALGRASVPVWSQVALHRPAEFNKSHVPAFLAGEEPRRYVCVYPFVRSYDWYLLPDEERRQMLADHGQAARGYPDVRANTVAAFALGDYEWILAFEADELDRIVDLMRHLRATEARRHVREEVPFFTGPRVQVGRPGRDAAVSSAVSALHSGHGDHSDPGHPRRRPRVASGGGARYRAVVTGVHARAGRRKERASGRVRRAVLAELEEIMRKDRGTGITTQQILDDLQADRR